MIIPFCYFMENYNDDKDCQYTEKICLMNIDDV